MVLVNLLALKESEHFEAIVTANVIFRMHVECHSLSVCHGSFTDYVYVTFRLSVYVPFGHCSEIDNQH